MNEKLDQKGLLLFVEKPQLSILISNNYWNQVSLYYLRGLPNTSVEIRSKN